MFRAIWTFLRTAFLAAGLCVAVSTNAAVMLQVTAGKLVGASGVVVDGQTYSVSFQDGTCATVFAPCGETGTFPFGTEQSALAAMSALQTQVLPGFYDINPDQIVGCGGLGLCQITTPFAASGSGALSQVRSATLFNFSPGTQLDSISVSIMADSLNLGGVPAEIDSIVFAVWTATPATVPEPGTASIVALALFGAAQSCRRRGKAASHAARPLVG